MRLGLWNRLAIVATILAVMVAPLWIIIDISSDIEETREAMYNLCMERAQSGPVGTYAATIAKCSDERFPKPDPARQGWSHWLEYARGTLIACGILYVLIWIVIATIKWVWRGRGVGNHPSA